MTAPELLVYALQVHALHAVSGFAAVRKYGDRTDLIAKSMQGTDSPLRVLRRTVSGELAEVLRKWLASAATVTTAVDPSSGVYAERPADVFAGEQYRTIVRMFVETRIGGMVDCRTFFTEREKWARHAERLSWCTIAFFAYQLVAAGTLFLAQLEVVSLSTTMVKTTFAPSFLLVAAIVACMVAALVAHDRISRIRMKYDEV